MSEQPIVLEFWGGGSFAPPVFVHIPRAQQTNPGIWSERIVDAFSERSIRMNVTLQGLGAHATLKVWHGNYGRTVKLRDYQSITDEGLFRPGWMTRWYR